MENKMSERIEKVDAMLPPPELLERYKSLGFGDNLIDLVKIEQTHRHNLQKKYLLCYKLGQILGFIIIMFFFYSIFKLMNQNMRTEAYILSGIFSILTLIIVIFLRNNRNNIILKKKNFSSQQRFVRPQQRPYKNNNFRK